MISRAGDKACRHLLGGPVRPYLHPPAGVGGRRRALLLRLGLGLIILLFLSGATVFSTAAAGVLFRPAAETVLTPSDQPPAPISTAVTGAASATAAPVVPAVPPGPDTRLLSELQAVVAGTRARVGVAGPGAP